ncbi:uncharacterized protein [Haliotis cracherodii]|uniref:uncharacterized protein n=1 Tax=Haliotis cracherodii TaxID=6455 RepID=UPI0039ED0B75
MDNTSLDKHDLPENSEILAPFGSIAFEGSLRSQRSAQAVDDGSVRSTRPAFTGGDEATQRASIRRGVDGVFQDSETGYRRKESVVYAQKGKAEVTFINIKLEKDNQQGVGKAKNVHVPRDVKSRSATEIQHHMHIAVGEIDAQSSKVTQNDFQTGSPSMHTEEGKDTSLFIPGPVRVSGDKNVITPSASQTNMDGPSSGLVLDPGKLESSATIPPPPPVSYVRKPTIIRAIGVRRLSEGSTPPVAAAGVSMTTNRVNISTIQHSDGSSQKTSKPDRDHSFPPDKGNIVDKVFDQQHTEATQPYRSGTHVRGMGFLEQKPIRVAENVVMHPRTKPGFVVVPHDVHDVSSPISPSGRVTISSTSDKKDIDPSASQLTRRQYSTTSSSAEASGERFERNATSPGLALNASVIQNTESLTSESTKSGSKRNSTLPRYINVVNTGTFQDVDFSTSPEQVSDMTLSTALNSASSTSTELASQRNSVASGCSYVSSVVDTHSRLDLERSSQIHPRTKWRRNDQMPVNVVNSGTFQDVDFSTSPEQVSETTINIARNSASSNDQMAVNAENTNSSRKEGLKEDYSVEMRSGILHVKDNRIVTSPSEDSKELYSSRTDTTTKSIGSGDRGAENCSQSHSKSAPSNQYHETTTVRSFRGTPNETQHQHVHTLFEDCVPNTGNDRVRTTGTVAVMNNPYFLDRKGITSRLQENKQSLHMVDIPHPQTSQVTQSQVYENESTGDLTKRNNNEILRSPPADEIRSGQRDYVREMGKIDDSLGTDDETKQSRVLTEVRRRKDGRIEHYNGKAILFPGGAVKVKHSTVSQHQDTTGTHNRPASGNREADLSSNENCRGFLTSRAHTLNMSSTDNRVISGKAGETDRTDKAVPVLKRTEAHRDTQTKDIRDRTPKEHRKHHAKFEYPTQSMKDALLVCKGYAGVLAPGVVEYDENDGPERANVVGDGELSEHQSVMDRVKSWVVSQDASESIATSDPSRDKTDSPRPFDRHSIAEMPLKVLATAVPIDQDDGCPDEVFEDGTHGLRDGTDQSVGDTRYLHHRDDLPIGEHIHVDPDVLLREDPDGSEGLARRVFSSLSTDPRTIYSRSLSDGFRKTEESRSEQVSIEMAELGQHGSDVTVTRHRSEGAIFNTSFLEGWEPSSPYAHRVKRNSSALSEGAQPISAGKPKIRQLSLAIGEEWEDMTGTNPVTSPDGTGSAAVSQRSLRRERSQQRSWSGCSVSSAPMLLGRTTRYMSHPARLENYLRRNTIPEGNESITNPPSPATTTVATVDIEEEKPAQIAASDDTEKRWLTPNPYNRINQRFHSTLQCPCYLFFCFLCCVPAVYYMQISDKEYDYGSKERSRVYGRRATVLYIIGAICATIFLTTVTSLVVIFMQEYLTRQQT